mgnify:FL=1|jgi:lipoprotein-releasing system permease protein
MRFNLFVAKRLFNDKGGVRNVSRPAIRIATAGVAIGLAVMIVSVCVVLGFKSEIRSKVIGFGSHIQIINYESISSGVSKPVAFPDSLIRELRQVPGVSHIQRFSNKGGILKTDDAFEGILLHGVGAEFNADFLKSNLKEGEIPVFSADSATNRIVVSQTIADRLHLSCGDRVFAYFFDGNVRARRFTVSGIYQTNLSEFDDNMVFTDLYVCNRLNNYATDQYAGVEITVDRFDDVDLVAGSLVGKVNHLVDEYGAGYATMTIRELYPQIFDWLDLLDVNVWVILILMVAVAGFTMISGLLIIILERTNFIGVMKALGATNRSMRHVFLYFAAFIVGRGLLWGNVLGIGLVVLQYYFNIVHLDPATYYVDAVPVLFNAGYILAINAATAFISVFVLILPSLLVSRIHPAKSIRFE